MLKPCSRELTYARKSLVHPHKNVVDRNRDKHMRTVRKRFNQNEINDMCMLSVCVCVCVYVCGYGWVFNCGKQREDMETGILVATAIDNDDSLSDGIRPEWCLIDRIVATRKPRSSQQSASVRQYLVKWVELPYDETTWEEEDALAEKVGEEEVRSAIERFEGVRNIARTVFESRQGGRAKDRGSKGSLKAGLAHEQTEEAFGKWKVSGCYNVQCRGREDLS